MLGSSIQRAAVMAGLVAIVLSVSHGANFDLDATSVLGTCEGAIAYRNESHYEKVDIIAFDQCKGENDYGWIFSCASTTSVSVQKYQYENCTGTSTTETALSEGDYLWGDDDEKIYFNCASDATDCSWAATFYFHGSDSSCSDDTARQVGTEEGLVGVCGWYRQYDSDDGWEYDSSYVGCSSGAPYYRDYNESIDCATGNYQDALYMTSASSCIFYPWGNEYLSTDFECASCDCDAQDNGAVSHNGFSTSTAAQFVAVAIIAQVIQVLQ